MLHMLRRAVTWLAVCCLLAVSLSGCGLLDYHVRLADGYTIYCSSAYSHTISGPRRADGTYVSIGTYISYVFFDEEYIFAQRLEVDPDYPYDRDDERKGQSPVDYDAPPEYYVIVLATDKVLGPMTATEFDAWYATLGRAEPPEWIRTNSEPDLLARSEALGLVTPEPEPSFDFKLPSESSRKNIEPPTVLRGWGLTSDLSCPTACTSLSTDLPASRRASA